LGLQRYQDSAAVVGVVGHLRAPAIAERMLAALSNRGGHVAAIASNGARIQAASLADRASAEALGGTMAIGERRLQVSGGERLQQVAPRVVRMGKDRVALALSGRIIVGPAYPMHAVWTDDSDHERVLQAMVSSGQTSLITRLVDALWKVDGGWACTAILGDAFVAAADPRGLRPLSLGELDGATLVASDSAAIRAVGGVVQRALEPGELLIVQGARTSIKPFPRLDASMCLRELVAHASDGSRPWGVSTWSYRTALAEIIAASMPGVDGVIGLGRPAGLASLVSRQLSLPSLSPLQDGLPIPDEVHGKRIGLVVAELADPEPIRTAVEQLRLAGALGVHVASASPPPVGGCLYGVESPDLDRLAAYADSVALHRAVQADLVTWIDRTALEELSDRFVPGACTACWGGSLPVEPPDDPQLPLFES